MYDNHIWLNCLCMTNLDRNQFINWKNIQILFEHWSPDSFFQMKHLRSLVIQKQLTHYLNSYIASFKECTFQFPGLKWYFTINVWIKKMPDVFPAGVISTEVPHFEGHTLQWCHFLHVWGNCWYGLNSFFHFESV